MTLTYLIISVITTVIVYQFIKEKYSLVERIAISLSVFFGWPLLVISLTIIGFCILAKVGINYVNSAFRDM